MRLEEMKNNIPETPDFIHKMVQEEVSRQLQDTKVVPMKKRKWNKVQAAAAAALCLLAQWRMPVTDYTICMWKNRELTVWRQGFRQMAEHPCSSRNRFMMWQSQRTIFRMA